MTRKIGTLGRLLRTRGLRAIGSEVAGRVRVPARVRDLRYAPAMLEARLRHGRPGIVVAFWGGIGDDVTSTVLARELRRRGVGPVWIASPYPDLFAGNDDVAAVVDLPWRSRPALRRAGWYAPNPRYFELDRDDDHACLVDPERHMVTTMCRQVGIVGPITRRPYLTLSAAERAAGARVRRQVAIQSSGLSAGTPMLNKQWIPERFQAVVTALRGEFDFVQLGATSDPPLDGVVLDLRGRATLRESAAVLSHSLTLVANVGLLMHMARAVECRSVIVYGGRERPDQSGYSCNENLYRAVPCSPCWNRNRCDFGRRCLDEVTVDDVVAAVRRAAARHGTPLEEDTDVIEVPPFEGVAPSGRPLITVPTPFGPRRVQAALLT